jgi:hypothetical protein
MLNDDLLGNDNAAALCQGRSLLVSSAKRKTLSLFETSLSIADTSDARSETTSLVDIIGATFDTQTCVLTVVSCAKNGKAGPRKLNRVNALYGSAYDGEQCAAAINCALDGQEATSDGKWEHRRRKMLVFINPFGGSGNAKQTYYKHCDEILNVRFDVGAWRTLLDILLLPPA